LNSSFIVITTLHVSGSLSAHHQEFIAVHRHWYILCRFDDRLLPEAGWNCSSILLLVANGHHNCIKCTKADVRLWTPDDGQKGCPKHVESQYQYNWNSVHLLVLFARNLLRCTFIRSWNFGLLFSKPSFLWIVAKQTVSNGGLPVFNQTAFVKLMFLPYDSVLKNSSTNRWSHTLYC